MVKAHFHHEVWTEEEAVKEDCDGAGGGGLGPGGGTWGPQFDLG